MKPIKITTALRTRPKRKVRFVRTQSTFSFSSSSTILNQRSFLSSSSSSIFSTPTSSIHLLSLYKKKNCNKRKKRNATTLLSTLLQRNASLKNTKVLLEKIHRRAVTFRSFLSFSKDCLEELSHIEREQQLTTNTNHNKMK